MKKIINGKKYDTDTAKWVGGYSNGQIGFGHCEEDLYRKKTGEFFLYGDGGPMSKYAKWTDCNTCGGGTDIIPLTEYEAKEWVEKHLDADDYEAIFGEVDE